MWCFINLLLLILFLIALYHRFNQNTRLINKIPGPIAWPIIGNSYKYLLSPQKLFAYHRSLPKTYGDVSQIYGLNVRMVNISNPKDVEKILSSPEYSYKEHPYTYLNEWLGSGLLLSNGYKWQQRKKFLTKAFHVNVLKKFMVTFVNKTECCLKELEQEVGREQTSLVPLFSNVMLQILCESVMGSTLHDDKQSSRNLYFKSLYTLGDCVIKRVSRAWLHYENLYQLTSIAKTQKIAIQDLHNFTNIVINERKNYLTKTSNQFDNADEHESTEKLAMLDLLLKMEESGIIDNKGINDEVNTFMFGGHDTTSEAMTYLVLTLANEPKVQDKLYDELYKVFGDSDRAPTMEDFNEMKYLDCCIKEILRLYPSVPIVFRYLTKEIILGGYTVPANTTCAIFIYDLLRRADIFPEPDRFIPERFLSEDGAKIRPYTYIPFSAGPRTCIGQKFALLNLKVMVSGLLRKFRLEPVTKTSDLIFKADMVLRTVHPVYARFRLRK